MGVDGLSDVVITGIALGGLAAAVVGTAFFEASSEMQFARKYFNELPTDIKEIVAEPGVKDYLRSVARNFAEKFSNRDFGEMTHIPYQRLRNEAPYAALRPV